MQIELAPQFKSAHLLTKIVQPDQTVSFCVLPAKLVFIPADEKWRAFAADRGFDLDELLFAPVRKAEDVEPRSVSFFL